MAFTLTREDESLPQLPIVVVIYADPGTGKTSLAFTAEKPLLMDFDKGAQRCINRGLTVGFDNWDDVNEFVEKGHLDEVNPKTIICDTAGTMLDDFIGYYVMKNNSQNKQKDGSISLKGYGAMKDVFNNFVMKELRQRGIDLVIIAHVTESEDDGLKIKRPKLTGGSKDILISKADLLGYMYMSDGKRMINFNPTDKHIGKNCAEFPVIHVKDQNTDPESRHQLADIIQQAKDHMSKMSEAQKEALQKIDEFRSTVESCKSSDEAQILMESINESLSDSYRVQMIQMSSDRFQELWIEENISSVKSVKGFNELIQKTQDLPKRNAIFIKKAVLDAATSQGILFNKEDKVFYKDQQKEASKAEPKEKQEPVTEDQKES